MSNNTITLIKIGDFYEAFDNDAATVARELDLTITRRNGRPTTGIPYHSLDRHLATLRLRGMTVQVIEK